MAHREALIDSQRTYDRSCTRGMAYQYAPPPQHGFEGPNPFEFAKYIPDIINLITHCFQNHDFSNLLGLIIAFIRNLTSPNDLRNAASNPNSFYSPYEHSTPYNSIDPRTQVYAPSVPDYPHGNFRN